MIDIIKTAIGKGAKLYGSISGGKDGQAMVKTMMNNSLPVEGLIHADLGRVEWKESFEMCEKLSKEFNVPLHIVKRSDGRDMIDHWNHRLQQLKGTGKPFWSSSQERYCTSDMKRDPINKFLTNCGNDFSVSCEGIRAAESSKRAKKIPLTINRRVSSTFYKGMSVEEAIDAFTPGKKLSLTWYPIFNFSTDDVWATYGKTKWDLLQARNYYYMTEFTEVPAWWPFHPAYVFGNERVSCKFCILGSIGDLKTGAKHDPDGILQIMIGMEEEGNATFKNGWSLKELLPA